MLQVDIDNNNKYLGEPEIPVEIDEDSSSIIMIDKPFDPRDVDIKIKPTTLDTLLRRLEREEIDMKTYFQRSADLWDDTKQSRLIESLLIRFPLPAFYFDGSNDDKWLIVDGLQRLSSLDNFVIKKTLRLKNLEFLQELNGLTYDQLPRDLQRRISESEITIYIINPGTPEEVKFNIFKRINTGGLMLESQEIRHALFQGVATDFISSLAESIEFKEATNNALSSKRMIDRDFVTRFVAFYTLGYNSYKPDMDYFLNEFMEKLSKYSEKKLNDISEVFKRTMVVSKEIFSEYTFRKFTDFKSPKKPLNKSLFEAWSVIIACLTIEEQKFLIENKETVKAEFAKILKEDRAFESSITTGTSDKNKVIKRFQTIENLVQNILNSL